MDSGQTVGAATPFDHALDALATCLDHLVKLAGDGALETYDDPSQIAALQRFEQIRNRMPLIDHQMLAEIERRDLPTTLCQGTVRRVLTQALSIPKAEAGRRVKAAAAIGPRTSPLGLPLPVIRPYLAAAQHTGQLSTEKIAIIERALARVDRPGYDSDDIDTGEQILTDHATRLPPEDLTILAARLIDAIDPDGTLPDDQLNTDRRHLDLRPTHDGAWTGELRLTATLGAKLTTLLDPLAKVRTDNTGQLDTRSHGQRMHDALEDICDRILRAGDLPDAGGTPTTVIVTIVIVTTVLDDLLDRTGHATTTDGALISTPQLLQLATEADIIPAVLNSSGAVLSLGRSRRIASRPQTLALIARDAGCSFPGCSHPPNYCERHHIIEWINGGPTDLNNLTLVCRYHHHNFASRGWTCRMRPDGIPEWIPPRWIDPHQTPKPTPASKPP